MRVNLLPSAVCGEIAAPPSKSMGHRALICAALASGESRIRGLGASQDMDATLRCIHALGAETHLADDGALCVRGIGGSFPPAAPSACALTADCGESGSTLRFFIPLFSLLGSPVLLTGHGRLMERPQDVYAKLFDEADCAFAPNDDGISLCGPLPAGEYTLSGAVSSQFISGLLFALPLLQKPSVLHLTPPVESRSYIDLTLRALRDFGASGVRWQDAHTLSIEAAQRYTAADYTVEGDYSQAAFPAVLGALCGGITVAGLREDSLQGDRVIFDILARCGAAMTCETRADGLAYHFGTSTLHGCEIDLADCPDLGPVLMVLGLFCDGETVIRNAERLRIKESDRIAAMEEEIRKLGGCIESNGGTVRIRKSTLHTANLHGHNDHRIVMALCVAALGAGVPVTIDGAEAVRKSWPDFFEALATLHVSCNKEEK